MVFYLFLLVQSVFGGMLRQDVRWVVRAGDLEKLQVFTLDMFLYSELHRKVANLSNTSHFADPGGSRRICVDAQLATPTQTS